MQKKIFIILILFCCACLFSFFTRQKISPKEKLVAYYIEQFKILSQKLSLLENSIKTNKDKKVIHEDFLQARLVYKKLELIIEYYFEGDAKHFNGLAVNFIEEEDPAAYQQPQGFQMIESFIYPEYDLEKKNDLLQYIHQLQNNAKGLGNNSALFNPQNFIPDAIMEELYRLIALGISGFDSPIAKISLTETKSALNSIQFMMQVYKDEWSSLQPNDYRIAEKSLANAVTYLVSNNNFDRFNRMEFITAFLNPLCDAIGAIKIKAGNKENPIHYSLIKKIGSLFKASSLDRNRYLSAGKTTTARIVLGKQLFYEPMLSVNNQRSCSTCHQQDKAFTDGLTKALQLDGHSTLPRNTPTLWNAALQLNLFYDSRHVMLEDVVTEVLGNNKEMNSGIKEAIKNLQNDSNYTLLFWQAYDETDAAINEKNAANAIATYIRTLISYNSNFDKYMHGEKNKMNTNEIRGFNLFMGKAKCGTCHYIPLFNGSKPPTYYYQESEVLGVPATTDTIHPVLDNDPGRMHTLNYDFFNHAFKTPTLRNIALTAPYMHNGVYKTLDEVIDFYDKGGGQGLGLSVPNQTLPADKLNLSATEKKQLKAFLLTLTDTSAIH